MHLHQYSTYSVLSTQSPAISPQCLIDHRSSPGRRPLFPTGSGYTTTRHRVPTLPFRMITEEEEEEEEPTIGTQKQNFLMRRPLRPSSFAQQLSPPPAPFLCAPAGVYTSTRINATVSYMLIHAYSSTHTAYLHSQVTANYE